MKKHTIRSLKKLKQEQQKIQMLTCYDFQTAELLNQTELDLILIGDSLGNVILGHETTVEVNLDEMVLFSRAVKRGAPDKFCVGDLPFGTYKTFDQGLESAQKIFQKGKVEAVKLEGAAPYLQSLITRLTEVGIPVMGHIGLTPQSVHQLGGYYTHGKDQQQKERLIAEAKSLEKAGVFALVLECVVPAVAEEISHSLKIPTIGIGSGRAVDGQVLVINDLLHLGKKDPPSFCKPLVNLYEIKKEVIQQYLSQQKKPKDYLGEATPSQD